MTDYTVFAQLSKLMLLTKTKDGYSKFIQTGQLELYDYNTGFVQMQIAAYEHPRNNLFTVFLNFATIDDGDFGGYKYFTSFDEAKATVKAIAENVFQNMVVCPNESTLNMLLQPYGMYVTFM